VGIADNFLSQSLSHHLRENLLQLREQKLLRMAGTGNQKEVAYNNKFRNDSIYWLDRAHNNIHENSFFELMDAFVVYLNKTCYTGITSYEFHYTLYETGSFYKKHTDQFQRNDSRKFSMIMYLNEGWETIDGGALCIYHENSIEHILPLNGKSVFLNSSTLEHEVLVCHKPRMSITGWLKS
jgi:SM-20-related protein